MLTPGVFNIMATPFAASGAVDVEALQSLTAFQIAAGADGLTILGIMGEAYKLRDDEQLLVLRTVMETVAGRVPVVVGASGGGPDGSLWMARHAAGVGAAAVLCAPPVNLRNLDAVFGYYRAVAEGSPLPVVVQDEPVQTAVVMPPSFLARLCNELPGCVAIKLEEAPTPAKISRVRALLMRELPIFGGLGGAQFYYELCRGAAGTMTGFSYTEILVAIHRRFQAGDRDGARAVYLRYLPLLTYEAQPGIGLAIRKELLRRRGAIPSAAIRMPGTPLDPEAMAEIDELLGLLGLGGDAPALA